MGPVVRRRRFLPAVLAVVLAAHGAFAQKPHEYQVKAAYLYGFARFVEWPPAASATTGQAFVLCVLGRDPFGRVLDDVVADAVVKEKPVVVRRISQPDEAGTCHTVFISASESGRLDRILDTLAKRPVLTVSDLPDFAQQGGIIGFTLEENRVRFVVNLAAAQASGLQLNSELLRVAVAILKGRQPGD
jgi:hypothetical protein